MKNILKKQLFKPLLFTTALFMSQLPLATLSFAQVSPDFAGKNSGPIAIDFSSIDFNGDVLYTTGEILGFIATRIYTYYGGTTEVIAKMQEDGVTELVGHFGIEGALLQAEEIDDISDKIGQKPGSNVLPFKIEMTSDKRLRLSVAIYSQKEMNTAYATDNQGFVEDVYGVLDEVTVFEFQYDNFTPGQEIKEITVAKIVPKVALFNNDEGTFFSVGADVGGGLDFTSYDLENNTVLDSEKVDELQSKGMETLGESIRPMLKAKLLLQLQVHLGKGFDVASEYNLGWQGARNNHKVTQITDDTKASRDYDWITDPEVSKVISRRVINQSLGGSVSKRFKIGDKPMRLGIFYKRNLTGNTRIKYQHQGETGSIDANDPVKNTVGIKLNF